MTPEQTARAIEHLKEHAQGACSACGGRNWQVVDIINPSVRTEAGVVIGGPTIPLLVVACSACGHCVHYSAVMLGLVEGRE